VLLYFAKRKDAILWRGKQEGTARVSEDRVPAGHFSFLFEKKSGRARATRKRNTRPAAFTSLMRAKRLHGARAAFFLIAMKSLFFGAGIFLGMARLIFS
jgi:hypothetical protein